MRSWHLKTNKWILTNTSNFHICVDHEILEPDNACCHQMEEGEEKSINQMSDELNILPYPDILIFNWYILENWFVR